MKMKIIYLSILTGLISCSFQNNIKPTNSESNINLGFNTNNSAKIKLSLGSGFNTKAINQSNLGAYSNIHHIKVVLSSTSGVPSVVYSNPVNAGSYFDISQAMINTIPNPPERNITLNNLKLSTNYYLTARAFSDAGETNNITAIDQINPSSTGGGTASTIEYIQVSSTGLITIANDTETTNTIDMNIQLMKNLGGSIISNSANVLSGTTISDPSSVIPVLNTNDISRKVTTNSQVKIDVDVAVCKSGTNSGNYALTWAEFVSPYNQIHTRLYDKNNNPLTGIINVTSTSFYKYQPKIVMNDIGEFIISWHSFSEDGNGQGVYAQIYNSYGSPVGGNFLVNTTITGDQQNSSVTSQGSDFLVTWQSNQNGNEDIFFRRYNNLGIPNIPETSININSSTQQNPSIKSNGADFVVVWEDNELGDFDILSQKFDSEANTSGNKFRVNNKTTGDQTKPNVRIDSTNKIIYSWLDGANTINAQYFDFINSKRIDEEFQVITGTDTLTYNYLSLDKEDNPTFSYLASNGTNINVRTISFDNKRTKSSIQNNIFTRSSPDTLLGASIDYGKNKYLIAFIDNNNVKYKVLSLN